MGFRETITRGVGLRHVEPKGGDASVIWIALTISVISLATALVAMRWARAAHVLAEKSKHLAAAAEERTMLDAGIPRRMDELVTGEPTQRQHIAAALDHADSLSNACHAVIRALDAGGEPPTSSDYTRVQRCSDVFTTSVGRMRASHDGDSVRELTDELVTLHHCIVTEIRQHQNARYPFVGAKDTTLASQVLRKFDAELARLRLYAQTGSVPQPNLFPVDFDTVRFVPKEAPAQEAPPAPNTS